MDFNFMTHDEDAVKWRYDYATKSYFDKDTDEKLPFKFDPDTGIFTTSKGIAIEVIPMSKFTLADFQHEYREQHEPKIPMHKVKIGDGENDFILEANENDTAWRMEYARYTERASIELLRFLIVFSVEVQIPNDAYKRLNRLAKRMGHDLESEDNEDMLIYYYVKDSLGADEQEMYAFFDVLLGRSMITQAALKRSEKRFPNGSSGLKSANVPTASE